MIQSLEDIILNFANGDFNFRLPISNNFDEKDVLFSAINMLGEELEEKTISRDYLYQILNNLPSQIIVYDEFGNIDFINSASIDFLNLNNQENAQKKLFELLPKIIIDQTNTLKKSKEKQINFEYNVRKEKDKKTYFACNIIKIKNEKTFNFIFIADDITEIKEAENSKIEAFFNGQENERKRLAFDLHDSLGQELNAIKIYFNTLQNAEQDSEVFRLSLERIDKLLLQSIESVREISFDLMPAFIENQTLDESITQLVKKVNKLNNIKINLETPKKERVEFKNKRTELMLYRVIQEFINNSIKHSNAKSINISINYFNQNKSYIFQLDDDGIGFDSKKINHKNGISNMTRRLQLMNTIYSFKSQPNIGTNLYFTINE